jgi:three-Cys-motif partner protein
VRKKLSTVWKLERHTAAKHAILRAYLNAWLPIMGLRYNERLVLVDAFCGPGVYEDGEPGSPIIMLNAFLEHNLRDRINAELVYLFIDEDAERTAVLKDEIKNLGPLPKNVTVHVETDRYENAFRTLLDGLTERGASLAPTFAFLDPFGYSDAPMTLTGRFLQFRGCEVLIYVPFPDIHRFIEREGQERALTSLLGGKEWEEAKGLTGHERLQYLHDLFKRQLENECGLEHVRSFQIVAKHSARGYHLFFGTNHRLGLHKMKDAMWSVDPVAGTRFQDSTLIDTPTLFESEPDLTPLREGLKARFGSRTFTIEEAIDFALFETPYRPEHVKTKTLRPMEREGKLEAVNPPAGRKRGFYPDEIELRFKP